MGMQGGNMHRLQQEQGFVEIFVVKQCQQVQRDAGKQQPAAAL
jgi:hypothetical protein